MFGVGKVLAVGASALVAGMLIVSSASAATVSVSMANPLLDAALLNDLGIPAADVSGVLPDGGTWFDSSMAPAPGKTTVIGNVNNTWKSPWADVPILAAKAEYWTTGTNGAPSPNAPNPGILRFDHQHSQMTMLWGSVDLYNSISFYLGSVLVDVVTGADVFALDTDIQSGAGAVLVEFLVSGGTFDRVEFSSNTNAFEVSNIEVNVSNIPNVPVPPTIFLLGSMLGVFGLFGFRRRSAASFG